MITDTEIKSKAIALRSFNGKRHKKSGVKSMYALEFETEIQNGQLTIPINLLPELTSYKFGKVVLLL